MAYLSLVQKLGVALSMVLLFAVPQFVLAALEVQFEETPLFLNADIKPGDVVSRTVTVTNTGPESQTVIFDFQNEFSDDLADVMELSVTTDNGVLVDNFFTNLFALGEIALGALSAGESQQYTFTAFLDPAIGNEYQLSQFGFDLVIGFQDGQAVTDSGGGSGGGGGGGSLNRDSVFTVLNEGVTTPTNSSAVLTWATNLPGTSYAVCGDLANGPFVLDAEDDLFGYEFASVEDEVTKVQHEVTFSGLSIGEYECRVASREQTTDEFTVSGPVQFALLPPGQVEGVSTSITPNTQPLVQSNVFTPNGMTAGASDTGGKGTLGGPTYAQWRADLDQRRAKEIAAEEAKEASSTRSAQNNDAVRERPSAQSASSAADNQSFGGFLGKNWWWLLALGAAAIVAGRALGRMMR
jgi:hypothetical protein